MADAQDSDSCPFSGGVGSSPIFRSVKPLIFQGFYFFLKAFLSPGLSLIQLGLTFLLTFSKLP